MDVAGFSGMGSVMGVGMGFGLVLVSGLVLYFAVRRSPFAVPIRCFWVYGQNLYSPLMRALKLHKQNSFAGFLLMLSLTFSVPPSPDLSQWLSMSLETFRPGHVKMTEIVSKIKGHFWDQFKRNCRIQIASRHS